MVLSIIENLYVAFEVSVIHKLSNELAGTGVINPGFEVLSDKV